MKYSDRPAFDKAVEQFRDFLSSQNVSTDLLWMTQDRISQNKRTWWMFRPHDLVRYESSRCFYESLVKTDSSIRIDGYPLDQDKTLAWVENYGGPSGLLNFGVLNGDYEIREVRNWLHWKIIRIANRLKDARHHSWKWNITPRQSKTLYTKH
ncbi:MAG: hypothetical protein QM496_10655 [Verrucomicrobiota bacterium]